MWEVSYGREPFDLRLTMLRLYRNLGKIIALTAAGTILFGGGYYVKNVLLARLTKEPQYMVTTTYKVAYTDPPTKSGDYYINEMSWNTYVDSEEFLGAVQERLGEQAPELLAKYDYERLAEAISAKLASDVHIPSITVTADSAEGAEVLCQAVQTALTQDFVLYTDEVAGIRVMDGGSAVEAEADVRPLRAFVLSAVLSGFFATVLFLLREIGDDSIWLPVQLRTRYGLAALGTLNSPEFQENFAHVFAGKEKIIVCPASPEVDVSEVVNNLKVPGLTAVPSPLSGSKNCEALRQADGVLLAVRAGSRVGKPLEYVLEYLREQDVKVDAALLWQADERLIRAYYRLDLAGTAQKTQEGSV